MPPASISAAASASATRVPLGKLTCRTRGGASPRTRVSTTSTESSGELLSCALTEHIHQAICCSLDKQARRGTSQTLAHFERGIEHDLATGRTKVDEAPLGGERSQRSRHQFQCQL